MVKGGLSIPVIEADFVGKWIPCSKRFPIRTNPKIKKQKFLVTYESGSIATAWYEYEKSEIGYIGFHTSPSPIIAWMPLPEAYKDD